MQPARMKPGWGGADACLHQRGAAREELGVDERAFIVAVYRSAFGVVQQACLKYAVGQRMPHHAGHVSSTYCYCRNTAEHSRQHPDPTHRWCSRRRYRQRRSTPRSRPRSGCRSSTASRFVPHHNCTARDLYHDRTLVWDSAAMNLPSHAQTRCFCLLLGHKSGLGAPDTTGTRELASR